MSTLKQTVRGLVPRRLRPHLGDVRRKVIANPGRIRWQVRKLLKDSTLSESQLKLLQTVNTSIHHRDGMYAGSADYFLAGLSAVECIGEVLRQTQVGEINEVLDLPSGYGRELRFLTQRFPHARLTACDIQPAAVEFCASVLGALPANSKPNIAELSFDRRFDLIWCGSLITHLDEASIRSLLKVFSDHLVPNGVMIVTTNGDYVAEQMQAGATYDLVPAAVRELTAAYRETGYAYSDYARGQGYFEFHPEGRGYGVSLTSAAWFRALAGSMRLDDIYFAPRRWANHQDVFGFCKS